ncbi:MAG: deoxyguanosinetriphosphate triphosphohydrolase [Sedimentisphaerales bacterium]|nr:deoxyguanosinetriphosphate triphosphohydrolase [Sedimentisphaerales bacterium]
MPDNLTNCAVTDKNTKGRSFPEKPHSYRSDFERDRDRIIHCSAFRRLEGKSQVFTPGLDDYYRTRLTHSIEVAQIGRTIAKELQLNEALTEAICLAHDIGHSPFGHAGERTLNKLMEPFGGFEHNSQALRIVDLLEHPYPDFVGLNLMYETRLGLAKHQSPFDNPKGSDFKEANCSLEGQIADLADRIAYNCHDLEDGLRAGIIKTEQLNINIVRQAEIRINASAIQDRTIRRMRTAKSILDFLVSDCLQESKSKLKQADITNLNGVYNSPKNLIVLSDESNARLAELESFLLQNFYMHQTIIQTTDKVQNWLTRLFDKLCGSPELMPGYFRRFIAEYGLERTVCDYIAGMTDRFCLKMLDEI